MNVLDAINGRRSIRKYTSEPISEEQLETILKAGFQAPSAHNRNPREYIVVRDREILEKITAFHPYTKMLPSAGCAIIVCGDTEKQEREGFIISDCSASIQNMLLTAHGIGLGGCWCGLYPVTELMEPMAELLGLPEHIIPVGIVAVGVKDEEKKELNKYTEENIHYNSW